MVSSLLPLHFPTIQITKNSTLHSKVFIAICSQRVTMLKLTYTYRWWQGQTKCDVFSCTKSYTLKRHLRFAKLVYVLCQQIQNFRKCTMYIPFLWHAVLLLLSCPGHHFFRRRSEWKLLLAHIKPITKWVMKFKKQCFKILKIVYPPMVLIIILTLWEKLK